MHIPTSSCFGRTERGPARRRALEAQRSWCQTDLRSAPTVSSCCCRAFHHQDYATLLFLLRRFFKHFSPPERLGDFLFGFLDESDQSITSLPDNWDMITSPSASALKNRDLCLAWESGSSRSSSSASINKPFLHCAPPSDPLRQASRLPIKVLKMLTARSGHILHPEYLQPLPSTPVSPIEVRSALRYLSSCLFILLLFIPPRGPDVYNAHRVV